MQYLANSLTAVISRRNYVCGAKNWIAEHAGNPATLSSTEAKTILKGAARLHPSVYTPAPPLLPPDLLTICNYLDQCPDGLPYKAALTIGFFGFLRSSNLLCPDATLWGGPHTLSRCQIIPHSSGLIVVLTSTKTIRQSSQPTVLSLPLIPSSPVCPTSAWLAYTAAYPSHPSSPAFTHGSGAPLLPSHLVNVMRSVLANSGCQYAHKVSMHSLRRGGTWAAVASQANQEDIASHGTWTSHSGMKAYLPSQPSTRVAARLATLFAL